MLYESADMFMSAPHKRITLMGMSNIGKTTLAKKLPTNNWFHYSVDYRLATFHLRSAMTDILKKEMMQNLYLEKHLKDDSICINLNVSLSNLTMLSHFLGKLGSPGKGGVSQIEFKKRQKLHRRAEIAATRDMNEFIGRSADVYGYNHFINDVSGSLCEIVNPSDPKDPLLAQIASSSLIVYIRADELHEQRLVRTVQQHPKPLYFHPQFLTDRVAEYLMMTGESSVAAIEPEAFVKWVFPKLIAARRPRYEKIALLGCSISADEASAVNGEADFLELIGRAIETSAALKPALAKTASL